MNPLHCTQMLNGEGSGVELCIVEIPISCKHKQLVMVDKFVGQAGPTSGAVGDSAGKFSYSSQPL